MHTHADPEEDTAVDVMTTIVPRAPWRVVTVEALDCYRLKVRFVDGTEGTVDMSGFVRNPEAGVFAPLRDELFFRQVRVELGVVTWPGNIDISPDAMHEAIANHGEWVLS